jgi:uncharacterized protein with beta-barrel porin domain
MKSHVLYDLRSYINYDGDNTVEKITVSMPYALLVNSNYIINQYNNRLSIQIGGFVDNFDFPYGNYSASSFMTAFSNLVSGYTISLNTTTNKFTISNASFPFTILGTSTIDYIMGFNDNIVSSVVGATNSAILPRVCNFLPNASFQICTIGGVLYNGIVLDKNGSTYGNVLCSVPNVSTNNTQLVYNGTNEEFQLQSLNQSFLEIAILDNNGEYIGFNGVASFFALKLKIFRRVEKLVGSFTDILKMPIYSNIPFENTEE